MLKKFRISYEVLAENEQEAWKNADEDVHTMMCNEGTVSGSMNIEELGEVDMEVAESDVKKDMEE